METKLIILLVVVIITWLLKLANKEKPDVVVRRAGHPRRPARPAADRLKNEIDLFLQEVTGKKRPPAAGREQQPIEIVFEESSPRPTAQRRLVGAPSGRSKPVSVPKAKPAQSHPGSAIENREEPGSKDLGAGLRSHLGEYMEDDRIDDQVEEHLRRNVDASVEDHLGTFSAAGDSGTTGPPQVVHESTAQMLRVLSLLRNPAEVQQAILVNEILSPPKSLRR